ncbi:mitochondrial nucleoid-associated protein 1 isoform X2 [Arvicanthis niloticus]|uniref:mitochondrial nucleoid-associated protein 1 isoform X2 n=1 Tax=Arvicanthis niloticus TaxID=61156 RepID=UPI00402BEA4A
MSGGAEPHMEVCPYCKKPFKRLKSHLPHCKMIGPSISPDQKVSQSKPAALAKKEKRPSRDLTSTKGKELALEGLKRAVKVETSRAEWTAATFPLPEGVLDCARTTEIVGETKDQNQLSFQALGHAKPEVTLQRATTPQSPASDATSPKRELTQDVSEFEGSPCCPSETEAPSLVSSMEPLFTTQDREYPSVQPHAKPAISARLKLDTVDPQRQKFRIKLLDVPIGDRHSSKNGSHGVQRVAPSVLSREKGSQDGGHFSGVSPHPGNMETQKSESLLLGLHPGLLGKAQVRERQELGLGMELSHSKGNTENGISVTVQEGTGLGHSGKDPITATEAKPQAALQLKNVFMPPQGALSNLLSVPGPGNQSLSSLTVASTPEEKAEFCGQSQVPAITLSVGNERDALGHLEHLEPTSFCQPHTAQAGHCLVSYPAQYPVPKNFISHAAAATSEALPRSLGLEWFPELYPAYAGLGVLPRRPQPWNSAVQMPSLATLQGRTISKVPWWGRSSADSRSLEPLALTTSSLPLMRLLGAVHKGWVQCNTTIKKSGVGGLTMLFAGYFVLCCSWSFKHLTSRGS